MRAIKDVFVMCPKCKTKWNSPIFFTNEESLKSAFTSANKLVCPKCGNRFDCNIDNMAYHYADGSGGVVGKHFSESA